MKTRGQAFETMMLVISVIVALAILAVLLGIIGNFVFPGTNDAKSAMIQGLRDINTKGYGTTEPKSISLTRGTTVYRKELIGNLPSITESQITFYCAEVGTTSGLCGTGDTTYIEPAVGTPGTVLKVKKDVQVYLVVCGDSQANTIGKYCVGVSKSPADATKACTQATACNIT